MSNIKEYTINFKFKIPEFNVSTWHDEIAYNFKAIDSLIANFVSTLQYKGNWKKITEYVVGDSVFIDDVNSNNYGKLFRITVDHTTTNDDFDTFLSQHSDYYEQYGVQAAYDAAQLANNWAAKTDGIVTYNEQELDYSSKAYAVGGTGTETNNAKYYKEQAAIYATNSQNSAEASEISRTNARSAAETAISARIDAIGAKNDAETAATNASTSATNAATSATIAQTSAQDAANSANTIRPLLGFVTLFDHKWSDHALNNDSWVRSDTFSWQSGSVYSEAYQHLVADMVDAIEETEPLYSVGGYCWGTSSANVYTNSENPSINDSVYGYGTGSARKYCGYITAKSDSSITFYDTISNLSTTFSRYSSFDEVITYYKSTDGHKICLATQENNVNTIFTNTGIAWYYILDESNTRFKLPRTKFGFVGYRDTVGKYVPESLPNIKGKFTNENTATAEGCFYKTDGDRQPGRNGNDSYNDWFYFDASRSSSTYQDNAPVQQRATQMYLYFYVGQFSQSATEQTAGLNSELFNGKVDRDLSNMNPTAAIKQTIMGWSMPNRSAGIYFNTFPYTCSVKGQVYVAFDQYDNEQNHVYVNGVEVGFVSGSYGHQSSTNFDVDAGDVITCQRPTKTSGTLYPLKGN